MSDENQPTESTPTEEQPKLTENAPDEGHEAAAAPAEVLEETPISSEPAAVPQEVEQESTEEQPRVEAVAQPEETPAVQEEAPATENIENSPVEQEAPAEPTAYTEEASQDAQPTEKQQEEVLDASPAPPATEDSEQKPQSDETRQSSPPTDSLSKHESEAVIEEPVAEALVAAPVIPAAAGPGFEVPPPASFAYLNKTSVYTKPSAYIPEEAEVSLAKSFLKAQGKDGGVSVYDHLSVIVQRILETRPSNAYDLVESISSDIKRNKFSVQREGAGGFRYAQLSTPQLALAKNRVKLLSAAEGDEEEGSEIPDVMELSKLWEWAGKLAQEKSLKSVRLWGKILGLERNYIIVEGDLKDGAVDEDDELANGGPPTEEPAAEEPAAPVPVDENENGEPLPPPIPLPKAKVKITPPLPREHRSGVNKYVYYVTSHAGGEFIRLPDVVPECLQVARKIRKYFTGHLEKTINSYPVFNGNEAQLLRCQIARISASTVVSPAGYYAFDPEEDAGDSENGGNSNVIMNTEYEGLTNDNLLNTSNWVHHVPYILPQGRVTWENPFASLKSAEEGEEEDDEEKEDGDDDQDSQEKEPESGPALLSAINADEDNGDVAAWSSRPCSFFSPSKYSPVTLRSNRWPGAVVVAYNDKFANVYLGDGQKSLGNPAQNFIVPKLGEVQKEFASGVEGAPGSAEDIVEQVDPTVEEEQAFEDSLKVKEEGDEKEEGEEGDGEAGDGEEKDEEEDEDA